MESTTDESFKNWLVQDVEETFGIRRIKESALLDRWLDSRPEFTSLQATLLNRLRQDAEENIDAWNEHALKFFFIGPMVMAVDFNEENFHGFLDQTLTVSNGNVTARGNVDFMVATGRQVARAPFYLLHDYKPEKAAVLDPQGQLLIAMLAARSENEELQLTQPVYGSYVLGRFWFFVVLNGEEYTISRAYDVTQPDGIRVILSALLQVKQYIRDLFAEMDSTD